MKPIASLPHPAGARLLATAFLLAVMGLMPASAKHQVPITAFGTVIDQPGKYILTTALFAGGAGGPAITILADHVHLDLNGFTIEGNGNILTVGNLGIHVAGTEDAPLSHIHIENGRVTGFYIGVLLHHASKCHIKHLTLDHSLTGIDLIGSSQNHIKENVATDNDYRGIGILNGSHRNQVKENDCSRNELGITLVQHNGDPCTGNQVKHNTCNENKLVGIWLVGECNENQIKNNEVMRTGGHPAYSVGIAVGDPTKIPADLPANNEIKNNVVLDNVTSVWVGSWDLFDNGVYQGAGCLNKWKNNVFDVDHEEGADAGPGVGCIQ